MSDSESTGLAVTMLDIELRRTHTKEELRLLHVELEARFRCHRCKGAKRVDIGRRGKPVVVTCPACRGNG